MESPDPREQVRKIKDKEQTRRKLIMAVGELIRVKGYTGLGVNKIAKQAGVNKKLIYRYFGSPENLIEAYVVEKDYWMVFSEKLKDQAAEEKVDLQETISNILEQQFDFFFSEVEMQQLILWEISGESKLMKSIAVVREDLAAEFLRLTDEHFENSGINFRALSALLSAGVYYMILHDKAGEYCGLDIKRAGDREEVKRTLRQIVDWAFRSVSEQVSIK